MKVLCVQGQDFLLLRTFFVKDSWRHSAQLANFGVKLLHFAFDISLLLRVPIPHWEHVT